MVDFTISDPGNTFLSQLKPTAIIINQSTSWITYITPAISFLCAVAGVWATWTIAKKAREITSQQRDIAEQAKMIALEKLEADIFEKRYSLYLSYCNYYNLIATKDFDSGDELIESIRNFMANANPASLLFTKKDRKKISIVRASIDKLEKLRLNNLTMDEINNDVDKKIKYQKLVSEIKDVQLPIFDKLMKKYVPSVMRRKPLSYRHKHPFKPSNTSTNCSRTSSIAPETRSL